MKSFAYLYLYIFFSIRQSDAAYVKLENLTVNTIYNVSVSIFKSMHEYRYLADTIMVRTLPSMAYRPQIIPNEHLKISNFTIDDDPKLLSAYLQWAPAEGMCFSIIFLPTQHTISV